jgi:hypothetical protein
LGEDTDLRSHLEWFLPHVERLQTAIDATRANGGQVDIFVGVFDVRDQSGLVLAHETMQELACAGVDVSFDLYVADDDSCAPQLD